VPRRRYPRPDPVHGWADTMTGYRGKIAVAALALTVTGCGQVLPLGPYASAPSHLAAPIILQLIQAQQRLGGCQPGYAALSVPDPDLPWIPGGCYRKTGTPVTFTSAAATLYLQPAGSGGPTMWGLTITLTRAEAAALTAITTRSLATADPIAFNIAGTTWAVTTPYAPQTNGRFQIMTESKSQALQLQRTLIPSD
jgi:hypothetical protein